MSRPAAGPSRRVVRDHAAWLRGMEEAIGLVSEPGPFDARAPELSGWSVGEHLEHLRLADRGMADWLEGIAAGRTAGPREGGPSLAGRLVLWTGFIPRGRGRAPEPTRPSGPERETTAAGLREVRGRVEALARELAVLEGATVTRGHPVLGHFSARAWLRFAGIHYRHHHKVIRSILDAKGG